ncbi:MAG: phosphoglucosamine mutase [Armatimonadetes bacterium]|nr:phosphoglucosamine mutase [Akkermansiaceae bacterium]
MKGKLFGTDGIRGKANEHPVTSELARKLGVAMVCVLGGGRVAKVLIGRDTRESGEMLEAGVMEGLLSMGAEVVRLGILPTPAIAYLVKELGATAAVMLTASHNPYEDNGMKIFGGDGFKLSNEQEEEIEGLLLGSLHGQNGKAGRVVDFPEGMEMYVAAAKASVGELDLSGLKIVVDAGNGAGYEVGPRIFKELGAEVFEMAVMPDGRNINAQCGALFPKSAGGMVRETGADLGVSLDGDADRVIFSDSDGEVVSGDQVLALCALGLKGAGKLRGNAIVATVMSNLGLDEVMGEAGIKVSRSKVGDRLVMEKIREEGLAFGGENSGHLIFVDHATSGDGILSALQVCKIIRESNVTLKELAGVMREYPSTLLNLPVREKRPLEALAGLQNLILEADALFGNEGRHLIRYSGTEMKIRVLVEHRDQNVVNEWIGKFKQMIKEELG